jgi:hypothetical protein
VFLPVTGGCGLTKNPRLPGNRGFSKFFLLGLEVPSHDAFMAGGAMPHGRLPSDSLVDYANLNSRVHLLNAGQLSLKSRICQGCGFLKRPVNAVSWRRQSSKKKAFCKILQGFTFFHL